MSSWKTVCEVLCAEVRAAVTYAGIYFRCLLIGYFEGMDGERGIAWRLADSLALRKFSKLDKSCLQVVVQRVG